MPPNMQSGLNGIQNQMSSTAINNINKITGQSANYEAELGSMNSQHQNFPYSLTNLNTNSNSSMMRRNLEPQVNADEEKNQALDDFLFE